METWLARVPETRAFPPDMEQSLRATSQELVIEMSSAKGCIPCGKLWQRLTLLGRTYGWRIAVLPSKEALLRSGRLGIPWVGHPVLWVRPSNDPTRAIPVAIGIDHSANLRRNIYLAGKMLAGVRVEVGLRAMAKFTGIVGSRP